MVSKGRANRIAQAIKEELSELLLFEVSDPRLEAIYVTYVRVDREIAFANVFVSALEGSERKDEILEGLESASGFLRTKLARKIDLRAFPALRFHWDSLPENADRIDKLISSLDVGNEGDGQGE